MIFLTAGEADKVRGLSPSKNGHALVPVECEDGRFKLGNEVLDDPAFAHVRDLLARLPRGEDAPAKEMIGVEVERDSAAKLAVWSAEFVQSRPGGDGRSVDSPLPSTKTENAVDATIQGSESSAKDTMPAR